MVLKTSLAQAACRLLERRLSRQRQRKGKTMEYRRAKLVYGGLLSTTLLLAATTARADEFMDACMMNSGGNPGMPKICSCMSANVSLADRADAAAALRKSNQSVAAGGAPLDPSTLPTNLQKGMQTIVLAQAQCM